MTQPERTLCNLSHQMMGGVSYLVQHCELVRRRVRFGCHVEVLYPFLVLLLFNGRELVEMCRKKAESTWSGRHGTGCKSGFVTTLILCSGSFIMAYQRGC